jgi:hypothetical protein
MKQTTNREQLFEIKRYKSYSEMYEMQETHKYLQKPNKKTREANVQH